MDIEQRQKHLKILRKSGMKEGKPVSTYWKFRLRSEELLLENMILTEKLKKLKTEAPSQASNGAMEKLNQELAQLRQANRKLCEIMQKIQHENGQLKKQCETSSRIIEGMKNKARSTESRD